MIVMRKYFFCFICLFFCSCGLLWEGSIAYVGKWGYENSTEVDLIVCMEIIGLNEWGEKCNEVSENIVTSGDVLWSIFETSNQDELNFHKHFYRLENIYECKVWLMNSNKEVLKLWVMGEDNGFHDIFDEDEWNYNDSGAGKDGIPYQREWTFTITDADIGLSPK